MIKWTRYGGYEISSKGDRRFSAFYARLKDGRTIEEAYQLDVKGYRQFGNNVMLGKGKPPLKTFEADTLYLAYKGLWQQWFSEHPVAYDILLTAMKDDGKPSTLSDRFAKTPINQARAISEILNEREEKL